MFSLFVAFEGVDSEKFNDLLGVGRSLYKFFSREDFCPAKTRTTEEDV